MTEQAFVKHAIAAALIIHTMTSAMMKTTVIQIFCVSWKPWIIHSIVKISELNPFNGGNQMIARDQIKKLIATQGIFLMSQPRRSMSDSPVLSMIEPAVRNSKLLNTA